MAGRGGCLDLASGSIGFESLFLATLTSSTIRAREAAVQDSENSVSKMHEKDSEDSAYKNARKNSEEGGRGERGDGRRGGIEGIVGSDRNLSPSGLQPPNRVHTRRASWLRPAPSSAEPMEGRPSIGSAEESALKTLTPKMNALPPPTVRL